MKRVMYTLLTLCIGIVIGTTSTTMAAPLKQYVQASFEKITFIVNGEEKELDADPLVYQGSTYLPVRTVLNVLGYDVGYKADTKTVTADKSIDLLSEEIEDMVRSEEPSLDKSVDNSEQIKYLNEYLDKKREQLKNYEQAIKSINERSDISQEDKNFLIELRTPLIEGTKKAIIDTEEKINNLQN
ncbi:hypothetical protein J41TS12_17310 [Paenibacillus antibioticophila]|uniref:Copper amine oxidase-like N-terminal domain-containing protein n=1 Tax=Paenibacillus antibioticophila TaxID=1274374 RepID=A0A919XTZ1_9BACL|nr:stalk domain-containing protein [Paenibacillus antibioticophila]GIO36870.1 hypothetical protein J41TS12_17310 [Paenibacillus antibioticophila]